MGDVTLHIVERISIYVSTYLLPMDEASCSWIENSYFLDITLFNVARLADYSYSGVRGYPVYIYIFLRISAKFKNIYFHVLIEALPQYKLPVYALVCIHTQGDKCERNFGGYTIVERKFGLLWKVYLLD